MVSAEMAGLKFSHGMLKVGDRHGLASGVLLWCGWRIDDVSDDVEIVAMNGV